MLAAAAGLLGAALVVVLGAAAGLLRAAAGLLGATALLGVAAGLLGAAGLLVAAGLLGAAGALPGTADGLLGAAVLLAGACLLASAGVLAAGGTTFCAGAPPSNRPAEEGDGDGDGEGGGDGVKLALRSAGRSAAPTRMATCKEMMEALWSLSLTSSAAGLVRSAVRPSRSLKSLWEGQKNSRVGSSTWLLLQVVSVYTAPSTDLPDACLLFSS